VWAVGEGFGGMIMGGMSLLDGVPGAELVYAIAAVVVWPNVSERACLRFGYGAWLVAWAG
jgi:hypothetical protein